MDLAGPVRVAVVGGGITGLAAAYALRAAAPDVVVTVLEAADRVGGKLRGHEVGGLALDAGAESMLARRPEGVDLARAVGLAADLESPVTTSAQVWSRGRLHPLPRGQVMGIPTDLHALAAGGLLSPAELLRVPLDRWLPPTRSQPDVSVGSYVRRRLGRAVVDRLVDPLLGGVYAGPADGLSLAATLPALAAAVRTERSLLAAATRVRHAGASGPPFAGLRGGMGRLPAAVARASGATVRTGATVRQLRRTDGGWRLVVGGAAGASGGPGPADTGPQVVDADAVVLAVPSAPAARLLGTLAPGPAAELARVRYASMALVTFVFPAGSVRDLPGSGLLVPAVERRAVKAATYATAKWSWVGGPGRLDVVRASLGRYGEEAVLQRDDAELAGLALGELAGMVGLSVRPSDVRVTRWGGGLPQYAPGHLDRVARVRAGLTQHPTLALAGAAYDGVGIPACIASGTAAAASVLRALDPLGEWTT